MDSLAPLTRMLLLHAPSMAVWTLGAAVALIRWQRHRGLSALVILVCCLMLFLTCASIAFNCFGVQYMFDEWGPEVASTVLTIVSFGLSLFRALALAGLLLAVFGWRDGASY